MPDAAIHPSRQQLTAFGLGKLPEAAAVAVASHLESCSACRQAVENQPPDSFLGKVREAKPGGSSLPPGKSPNLARGTGASLDPVASPPASDLPAELVNHAKYRIVRELGRGGMGVVYLAVHKVMDRPIAIKVINPSVLAHPDALPRFHSEVRTAAKLDHPNIVRALDADQVGSLHLLVMEYVEGKNLDDLVRGRERLPILNACHYVRQAALGLQHAFEQGMVHRDIKPGNLVLTPRGQVKILDFGLARLRDTGVQSGRLTAMDSFMGTPEYVSPEQATDARTADTRADIYSLGCTLFYLLTGRPPFQEETVVKLVLAHIEKEAPLLHELRSDVPPELSAVVAQMLAKDPAKRYQTPVAVAQALVQFAKAGGKPAAGRTLPPPQDVGAPARATSMGSDTSKVKAPAVDAALLSAKKNAAARVAEEPFKDLEPAAVSVVEKMKKRHLATKSATTRWGKKRAVLAGAIILLLAFAGLWASTVLKVKTKDGTIVLENLPAGAEVLVDGEKVTVTWGADGKKAQLSVPPGTHKIVASKDGVKVIGEEIQIEDGGHIVVTARLEKTPNEGFQGNRPGQERDDNGLKMKMCWCPAGSFRMGSPKDEPSRWPSEQVEVKLTKGFWLGKFTVTQQQWQEIMGTDQISHFSANGGGKDQVRGIETTDFPMDSICWYEAIQFCRKLTERDHQAARLPLSWEYTLPTEAQWEYACRAGTRSRFSFGDDEEELKDYAWYEGNSDRRTHAVGTRKANGWGFHGMHGEVWQWCYDLYQFKLPGGTDPVVTTGTLGRVRRGGSWDNNGAFRCGSAQRGRNDPASRDRFLGFRVAAVQSEIKEIATAGTDPQAVTPSNAENKGSVPLIATPKALGFMGVQPGQERDDNSLKMKFCWCPPGQFRMGSPANEPERRDDEDQVEVKFPHGFWMAKYPVTQGEWKQLMGSEPSCFCAVGRGKDKVQGMDTSRFPVEQVNHDDATSFAQRFTKQERSARRLPAGWEYRLPTEGQWEYACRAGTQTATAFGDQLESAQANFGGSLGRTCRVGSYPANAWGLYDMHGNVWQWCRDWYGKKLPGGEDPEATVEASARVLRGIGWNDAGTWCRAAGRRPYGSWVRDVSCGFRVAAVQSSRQLLKDEPATPKTQGFIGSRPGQERDDNSLKMKFCWCPPGQFTMGSPADEPERRDDEDQVEVWFPHGFWMAKYAVTQGEWKQLIGTDPSYFCAGGEGKDKVQGMDTSRFPVEGVNYEEATRFAQRFTVQERSAGRLLSGWEYRLPTEAQWEYACRAGTKTATAFGDSLDSTQANFIGNRPYNGAAQGPYLARTTAVGSYPANEWGLHDMHGNLWQWCRDWYVKELPGGVDPEVTVGAPDRVLRGECWWSVGGYCRSAVRPGSPRRFGSSSTGFAWPQFSPPAEPNREGRAQADGRRRSGVERSGVGVRRAGPIWRRCHYRRPVSPRDVHDRTGHRRNHPPLPRKRPEARTPAPRQHTRTARPDTHAPFGLHGPRAHDGRSDHLHCRGLSPPGVRPRARRALSHPPRRPASHAHPVHPHRAPVGARSVHELLGPGILDADLQRTDARQEAEGFID
ncbi:MAG TPA: SUMF1/EgtB/PvdO family nonheme iron enzyme [Gemmataceae bacterium]|nr:SUMF1/EgtB/PvdO family nonheme iron enzyme [Gemmataceae bacterium]